MPSKLNKVQKHVTKKKGAKLTSLHENSRDARRLRRAGARDERVSKTVSVREKANRHWLERITFFQDRLPDTLHPFELEEIQSLVRDFVDRNDEEMAQLKAERRPGRPPSTRHTILERQIELERREAETGFWMPDLRDVASLQRLDEWKGDWSGLANMRFVRVDQAGTVNESSFPPRGAS